MGQRRYRRRMRAPQVLRLAVDFDRRVSPARGHRCALARRQRTEGQAKTEPTAAHRPIRDAEAPRPSGQQVSRSRGPALTPLRRSEPAIATASAARSIATVQVSAAWSGPVSRGAPDSASTAKDASRCARWPKAAIPRSMPRSSRRRGIHRTQSHAPLPPGGSFRASRRWRRRDRPCSAHTLPT